LDQIYGRQGNCTYIERKGCAMYTSNLWSTASVLKANVRNSAGENLGKIDDLMTDDTGRIHHAVLAFGGVLGMGDRLVVVPWSAFKLSPTRDTVILDMDRERLLSAPSFKRGEQPNFADPAWRRHLDDYYPQERPALVERPAVVERPIVERPIAVVDRPAYVERPAPARKGISVIAGILLIAVVLAAAWVTYLATTRGWDQTKQDIRSTMQSAAYAAKETSQDAALTTKVKTALSLSKRIPADKINVDSQGGIVTLRGEVASNQIRNQAEMIAQEVPGVAEVHNHLFAINNQ